LRLARNYRKNGRRVVFDANVNYYQNWGESYYSGMLPTGSQTRDAISMTAEADGVIADSEFLASVCGQYNANVEWIPDSVRMDLVPKYRPWNYEGGRLRLLWCGEAVKLFDLLAIEGVLQRYADRVELVLVTNSLSALDRWHSDIRERFTKFLENIQHRFVEYRSPEHTFEVYGEGGVFISPRFLDNSYNLGHTEWKVTLPMACGRVAFCSPLQSYVTVSGRSGGQGIKVCEKDGDWAAMIETVLLKQFDFKSEEEAARDVVDRYYSTEKVAAMHTQYLNSLLG